MEKKQLRSKFSPETLAKEWRQAMVFLQKMEYMAQVNQKTSPLMRDRYAVYDAIIRHTQEAAAHLQAMFDELGRLRLEDPTILH